MVQNTLPERRKALIMRILENTAIDSYRKNKKNTDYIAPVVLDDTLELASDEDAEDHNLVYAILKMPLQYRQIFYLKYAHGYNNKEIAQLLGITVSSIEKILSRGKKKLNGYLKEVTQ
jgi:RNA polymerase sigma-70 factor (ECF subfamily)